MQKGLIAAALALACAGATAQAATVAVRFDKRTITVVEESGLADPATGRRVTADDPVRIASISKLVVALGVMRLVEQEKLDLDRDVSAYLGWELRNPVFPGAQITLRMMLSHRSSLTDAADYVVPLGDTLRQRLADPRAWDSNPKRYPGSWFRYSNLNYPVIASVMERATGERFDRLMKRLVIDPLDLDACFNWATCKPATIARAVVLTDAAGMVLRDDLNGRRPDCPVVPAADGTCDLAFYKPGDNGALFSPQGGLRISARDLAKIGQMLLRDGGRFLSRRSIEALREEKEIYVSYGDNEGGFFCSYGLGVHQIVTNVQGCRDNPFGDRLVRWGHSGEAYGLRSGLWIDDNYRAQRLNKGIAFFTTAVPDDAPKGRSAFTAAEEAVIARAVAKK